MIKKIRKTLFGEKYPFICTHPAFINETDVRFHINNPIEGFRLVRFGLEKDQLLEFVNSLEEGDIVYDVGSSVGAWSIPSAMKVGARGQVVSFEPDPENVARVKANFVLNKLDNYIVLPVAVGAINGEIELFTSGSNAPSPSLKPVNNIATSIQVKMVNIDGLLESGEVPIPNVIKLDIEGAEMMALQGMENLLKSSQRPRLLVTELHPKFLPSFDTDLTAVIKYLIDLGYKIDKIDSREDQVICFWV